MASSDDGNRPSVADERGNPFVTFRRFADEQLAALLRTALSFPSSSLSANQHLDNSPVWMEQQRQQHLQEANEMERSLNNLFKRTEEQHSSPDTQAMFNFFTQPRDTAHSQREQPEAYRAGCEGAWKTMSHVGASEQEDDLPRRCPYRPANQDGATSTPAPAVDANVLSYLRRLIASPLDDFLDGRTSTLRFEVQDAFHDHSVYWKKAFEDLLGVQHAADSSEESARNADRSNEEWIKLFEDRSFADPLQADHNGKSLRTTSDAQSSKGDAYKTSLTELDLYERFLGAQWPGVTAGKAVQSHSSVSSAGAESSPSSIISTLTTTERSALPDGSVVTKVVLKKRFADGKEEYKETEHTNYNTSPIEHITRRPQQESDASLNVQDGSTKHPVGKEVQEKQRRGGWFWS